MKITKAVKIQKTKFKIKIYLNNNNKFMNNTSKYIKITNKKFKILIKT